MSYKVYYVNKNGVVGEKHRMKEQLKALKDMAADISEMKATAFEILHLLDEQGFNEQFPETLKEKALKMGFAVIRGGALQ